MWILFCRQGYVDALLCADIYCITSWVGWGKCGTHKRAGGCLHVCVCVTSKATWKGEKISEINFGVNLPAQMFQYSACNLHNNNNMHAYIFIYVWVCVCARLLLIWADVRIFVFFALKRKKQSDESARGSSTRTHTHTRSNPHSVENLTWLTLVASRKCGKALQLRSSINVCMYVYIFCISIKLVMLSLGQTDADALAETSAESIQAVNCNSRNHRFRSCACELN